MPPKPKFTYNQEDMQKAVNAVKNKECNVYKASILYKVPRSSLQNILNGKTTVENRKLGPPPVLGQHEILLVNWIEAMSQRGFPIVSRNLLISVGKIAKDMGISHFFNDGNPSKKWLKLFMKRHPTVAKRTVEKVTKSRSQVTQTHIEHWFENVHTFLTNNNLTDILDDPSRIFNTDESGFMLCPKGEKVLSIRGEKNVYEVCGNNEKQQITVLVNISANGAIAPTMLVFSGKRMPKGIAKTMPKDWAMAVSDKGWITGETFFEYVANVFYPWLIENKIQLPVLLFLDGHVSHLTYHLSMFCREIGIHIVAFYPNSTHIQQPLDVAIFGPLKKEWVKVVHDWRMTSEDPLTKYHFAPLLDKVITNRLTKQTIKNGFRTTGLYPWDSKAIDFSKCLKKDDLNETEIGLEVEPTEKAKSNENDINGHKYLENLLEDTLLDEFKNNLNNEWKGSIENKQLFEIWKKSIRKANITGIQQNRSNFVTPEKSSVSITTIDIINDPSTPIASCSQTNISVGSEEKRRQQLAKKISPLSSGEGVPTPFKKNLFWPKSPKKTKSIRRRLRMPAVVTSGAYDKYEEDKESKKQIAETLKAERKRKRDERNNACTQNKVRKEKKLVFDEDEDWVCTVCTSRYSSEVIRGLVRQWVECDGCKKQFYTNCLSTKQKKEFGLSMNDNANVDFLCHFCVTEDDDSLSGLDEFESDDEQ